MNKGLYKRYGCKMGCGCYKCRNDTPRDSLARRIMKHICKVRERLQIRKEVEEDMKK